HYALLRIEEVGLGVVVSMVVQVVVFPRYAATTYRKLVRASLAELAETLPQVAGRFGGTCGDFGGAMRDFPSKSTQMRMLLRFAVMESKPFRRDIVRHTQKVAQVNIAAALVRSSASSDPAPEPFRGALGGIVTGIAETLREGFLALEEDEPLPENWKSKLAEHWSRLDAEILKLRADPELKNLPSFETAGISIHLLNLRELSDLVLEMDRLDHTVSENHSLAESLALAPAWPSGVWIHRGIRAGLATVFALVIENWLNPPGGSMMMLCVYAFTSLNALSPNESGDRPAMRQVLVFFLVMTAGSLVLLVVTPMMASYAVLNCVIAAWAFLFGYWLHRTGGVSVPLTFCFMLLVGVLALNPQQPVGFQDIAGFFFGFMNGLVISSVFQRLFWPVLPQTSLRTGLQNYCGAMVEGLAGGMARLPLWRRMEHVLFPAKARMQIANMAGPTCPPAEAHKLEEFVVTLQELSREFALCAGRLLPQLPPEFSGEGAVAVERTKAVLREGLHELGS
ncbi:MAG: FUSC family protein, partial [Verrucomicrobiota bacterium]